MQNINFEGLGLNLEINRVAIEFGNVRVYWYGIFIVLAIAIAILLCKKDNGKYNIKFEDIILLAVFVIPISIICARIYYIVFRLDYYIQNPIEMLEINNGGLAIYGGIIGGILVVLLFCKKKKIKFLDMLDYIAPVLALGQCIGRWGNFFNGEAYGTQTSSFLRMGIFENGEYIQVHPTFLYESICTFIIFLILYIRRNKRAYSGEITYKYLFLYGIVRALIEGLRTDSLMLGNIRISQLLSIILAVIFGTILMYKRVKRSNTND